MEYIWSTLLGDIVDGQPESEAIQDSPQDVELDSDRGSDYGEESDYGKESDYGEESDYDKESDCCGESDYGEKLDTEWDQNSNIILSNHYRD
jgi:hypothetical protein